MQHWLKEFTNVIILNCISVKFHILPFVNFLYFFLYFCVSNTVKKKMFFKLNPRELKMSSFFEEDLNVKSLKTMGVNDRIR